MWVNWTFNMLIWNTRAQLRVFRLFLIKFQIKIYRSHQNKIDIKTFEFPKSTNNQKFMKI